MNLSVMRRTLLWAFVLANGLLPSVAPAQTFPVRPITLVISFGPGGVTDIVGRMLAEPMSRELGQPVIVENIAGAGGNIAFVKVAQAKPDGYTLLLASTSTVTDPALHGARGFDPVKSYSPIGYVGSIPFWLLVNGSKPPATSATQLVQIARASPGKLTYGSGGIGTASHLGLEYFKVSERLDILHVAYKGQGAAVTDLLASNVDMVFMPIGGTEELVKSGKFKAVATTASARLGAFPDVPTFAESGFPKMDVGGWLGMVAPTGTPADVIEKLAKTLNNILAQPEFRAKLIDRGLEGRVMTPFEFGAYIEREVARWKDVVARTGIKAE
jgi:tripartite-type tricarboxylate transporter receptor subunit TctC